MKKFKEKLKDVADGFVDVYSVELYMHKYPIVLENKLLENMRKYCGNVDIIANKESNITFAFMDHILEYKNANVPPGIAITIIDEEPDKEELRKSLEQSWNYSNKNELIENCKVKVIVSDFLAIGLEYGKRVELFQQALYAIVEVLTCQLINFNITEQLITREEYLENNPLDEEYDPLFGMLNVRKFHVEGKENEYIMDTLGLSAIGLCDLQCHYKNLDTNQVSEFLYSYGYYIFDNQDAAENIKEIEGISLEGSKWKCQHEVALVEPERIVLDINPGKEFSSEDREEI